LGLFAYDNEFNPKEPLNDEMPWPIELQKWERILRVEMPKRNL
jgi:hypothetical protein